MKALVPHDKSMFVHHHEAHALYGFYDSPFHNALVLTMDGGGDDGHFCMFFHAHAPPMPAPACFALGGGLKQPVGTCLHRLCVGGGGTNGTSRHIQHSPGTPTTGLRSRSTGRSGRQNAATRRNMRREERVTVQGPVKKQRPNGMSHRGGGGGCVYAGGEAPPPLQCPSEPNK